MKKLLILATLLATPAYAGETAALKSSVSISGNAVTLNDLLQKPVAKGDIAIFGAPAPGASGTISVARIVEAAKNYGVGTLATPEADEIHVERDARKIDAADIEKAIAQRAATYLHADLQDIEVAFPRTLSDLNVEKDNSAPLSFSSFRLEPVSGRFEAKLFVPGSTVLGETSAAIITGTLFETTEAVQMKRTVARGDVVTRDDIEMTRLKRPLVASNVVRDLKAATGMTARHNLTNNSLLRDSDMEKTKIVGRNDLVLIVFETPAILVTTRGKAMSDGALGDVIDVLNTQSKHTLQATVVGEGKVSVNSLQPGRRVASATQQVTAQNE